MHFQRLLLLFIASNSGKRYWDWTLPRIRSQIELWNTASHVWYITWNTASHVWYITSSTFVYDYKMSTSGSSTKNSHLTHGGWTTMMPMPVNRIALMHVYVTQANFTTKPRFEIKNKRSFTEMNSQGSRVEKNTHAQKVQMQKILFTNEACWWNLLVWRNHA